MKINVPHIAKLANIPLTEGETHTLEKQLSHVLQYVEKLQEVHTENIIPTSQVTGLENVIREDITASSLPQHEALSNTSSKQNGLFQVKGILDSE